MDRTSVDYAPMVHLYAEHLQNIRTLSIQASLATTSNQETKATLCAKRDFLTLEHEGEKATIRLPVSLGSHSDVTLIIPAPPTKDLTFRLNIEERPDAAGALSNGVPSSEIILPWIASDFTPETAVSCATCQTDLVRRGQVQQWKDLPSEGWAEMMDFWHCHKPDEPHGHSNEADNVGRGFAASSKLVARPGIGLVGPMDFLLAAGDCPELELQSASVLCPGCHTCIGVLDPGTEGYKLRKPNLSVSVGPSSLSLDYSHEKWLSSALLTAAESQGVRRLAVYASDDGAGNAVSITHVWLFAPDLRIASSAAETPEAMRVLKVLYRDDVATDYENLGKMSGVEGELEVSKEEWREMRSLLDQSVKLLPEKARRFQQWNVGLLKRFTGDDVSDLRGLSHSP
ncbi:hypothetical protein B0A55_07567 [Friedmanniomyces simplex]|uniref:Ubiquitin-conjugating enzyme E2C-binding protein n=1 Tax=Friedmanniomyces simplex TaxID=329884 RepID=A0A4U0X5B2_9PEZI|nr:hypothetical protein B0A55_07567 [Friedmanniomyces simplex]